MPPPPSSLGAFAPALVLNLERSRLLRAYWYSLHVLLGVAFALVGWVVPFKLLSIAAVVGHCIVRLPAASPRIVLVAEGGRCIVPEWNMGPGPLGPRTLVSPFWVRLDLGTGPCRRDILLLADQMRPEQWRRLRALLLRIRCE